MMNMKQTKRALLSSVLALFLCFTMLLGTTFAWFTDSVTSTGNIIQSGSLNVEMYYADGTQAVPVDGANSRWLNADGATIYSADQLWEPGYTDAKHIKISNEGTLALKYQLAIIPTGEVSILADVIDVYYIESATQIVDRTDLTDYAPVGTLRDVINSGIKQGNLSADTDYTATIVLAMRTDAGNEYQDKSIGDGFTIQLLATQYTAEDDSFGNDYDDDAWMDGMKVYNAADLQAAISAGENVVLMNDIELTEAIVIPAASSSTFSLRAAAPAQVINLNGKTLSNANGYVIENQGNIVITGNGTMSGMGCIRSTAGSITIENGNFYASSRWQDGVYQHTLKAENSTIVINGGNFDATVNGQTNAMIGVAENSVVTINGGSFKNVAGELGNYDPYMFNYEKDGKVIINDGTFYGGWRFNGETATTDIYGGDFTVGFDGQSFHATSTHVVTVYGGTFTAGTKLAGKLNDVVADGRKGVAIDGGKYVVVSDTIADENVVSNKDQLKDALTDAADAASGDNTIFLTGNIDLSGTTWNSISVDGYNGAGIITIEGNGATIKGLTAPLFKGGFAGKSGIVIKNLTIADSNIVSTSGLGGGAFVDTADSMQVITLDNCHLINSTVSGERTGGLIGWCSGYAKENDGPVKTYVTITNCSVIDSDIIAAGSAGAIAGHPGASDYTYTTIENCVVRNVDVISNDSDSWRTGAIVGTANNGHIVINNATVENVTLTQNGVTAEDAQLYGRFVPSGTGTLVIDGSSVLAAATNDALKDAIASGTSDLYLPAGDYKMPGTSDNLTISGTKDTVVTVTGTPGGSNVTFNGVTVKGSGYATGVNAATVTYNDATIIGEMCLYREKVVFNNCTFELNNQYIWTYGAKEVVFNNCTFNTNGKAILIYNESSQLVTNVTVTGCTFNASAAAYAGTISNQACAAIEIGSNLATNGHYTLTTSDNTVNGFSGEWRIKASAGSNVTVNGTVYEAVTLDGVAYVLNGKEVTKK